MWSNESDSVLAEFKAKAERAKQEHQAKHPDYQYQPRKPCEKKRRMTKKKAESISHQVAQRVSSTYPASITLSNLKTKGGRRATLPLSKESKKKIAEQNKTSKTDTLEEPQELGSSWGFSDYAQSIGDLDAGFFDMPETVDNNNNNFLGALDKTDLLGQDSYLDDIRTIFDPLNSFEPSPTAMRSTSIYAASEGWTI
jgi:hypothetical protein